MKALDSRTWSDLRVKMVSALAVVNATLAAVSALLAAAPLTGALLLFIVWVPLAAYFARRNQSIAALSVPVFAGLGLLLSPVQINHASIYFLGAWCAWVLVWSALVVYFSRAKLMSAITTARGGGGHGV